MEATFLDQTFALNLRNPDAVTIMCVTTMLVVFAHRSSKTKGEEEKKKLRGVGWREWFNQRPVLPAGPLTITFGAMM